MAGSAGGVRAGKAFIELYTDDSKLVRGLRAAQAKLQAWGAGLKSIGSKIFAIGFAAKAAMETLAYAFAEGGSKLLDLSEQSGISVEALSGFRYAAEATGATVEDVAISIKKMQKSLVEAKQAGGDGAKALSRIGLSAGSLLQLSPEEQFRSIAAGISEIQDPALRTATALQIMGKSATTLIPTMLHLAENEARFKELGLGSTKQSAEDAKKLSQALRDMGLVFKKILTTIGGAVAGELTEFVTWLGKTSSLGIKWVKENKGLIVSAFKLTKVVIGAGLAIYGLGVAISAIGSLFGIAATIITAVGAGISYLLSPVILLGLGIAALAGYFIYSTGIWKDWLKSLTDGFNVVKTDALAAFGAIRSALAAGDIGAAWDVVLAGLKLGWLAATNFFRTQWVAWKQFFLDVFNNASASLETGWFTAMSALEGAWVSTVGFFDTVWTKFINWFSSTWQSAIDGIANSDIMVKAIAKLHGVSEKDLRESLKEGQELSKAKIDGDAAQRNADLKTRQGGRDARQAKILQDAGPNISGVEAQRKANEDANQAAADAAMAQIKADLAAARITFDEAVKRANAAGDLAKSPGATKAKGGANGVEGKLLASGTFSASAVSGLGAGDLQGRMYNAQDDTRKTLRKMHLLQRQQKQPAVGP